MNKCKHCQQEVKKLPHVCEVAKKTFWENSADDWLFTVLMPSMFTASFDVPIVDTSTAASCDCGSVDCGSF